MTRPRPPRVRIHIETGPCEEVEGCALSGFHFHWRGGVYRSAFDGSLSAEEADAFDADCAADHADREAAREAR